MGSQVLKLKIHEKTHVKIESSLNPMDSLQGCLLPEVWYVSSWASAEASMTGFLSGCTTFLFPCTELDCMESYLMSETDGRTRVYACCTGGACKVLSLCVIRIEDSSSENLVNLHNLDFVIHLTNCNDGIVMHVNY
jgi:hypothetical protein